LAVEVSLMPKKHDHTKGKAHIRKTKEMMRSPAYRDLRPAERALLDELLLICDGPNNGKISLEVRQAAKLIRCTKGTVSKAFHSLAAHGFIENTRGDRWQDRVAREWRLTSVHWQGREPTNDWMRWQPGACVFDVPARQKKKGRSHNEVQTVSNQGTDVLH
jgi:hypothetical protein